jgi:acid phosphatase type 7
VTRGRILRYALQLGLVLGLVVLGLLAPDRIGRNRRGFLAAPPGGDLSLGPAPRGDVIGRDAAACGAPGPTAVGALQRRPYLQLTSDTGTAILWTAPAGVELGVRLWRGDGGGDGGDGGADERRLTERIDPVPAPDGATQWIAQATGLAPGAVYCYELVGGGGRAFGPIGFRTAPAADDRTAVVRAVALGDMGFRTSDQAAVLGQLLQSPAELALLTGDLAYPYGRAEELEDHFFSVYAPLMARLPFFPAAGNHDYMTDDGAPLRAAFALPDHGGPEGRERWYAFDWGPLRVVVLDTERLVPAQLAWLERELAAPGRPWTLVALHRPPFTSGARGLDLAAHVLLHPVFARHRVPLVLAGHDHHYERSGPIDGVTYVITGGGGRGTYPVGRRSFTVYAAQVAHHVVLEADAGELRLWAVDGTGATFDTLRLSR